MFLLLLLKSRLGGMSEEGSGTFAITKLKPASKKKLISRSDNIDFSFLRVNTQQYLNVHKRIQININIMEWRNIWVDIEVMTWEVLANMKKEKIFNVFSLFKRSLLSKLCSTMLHSPKNSQERYHSPIIIFVPPLPFNH